MDNKFNIIDVNKLRMPKASGKLIGGGVVAVALLLGLSSTVYQVQPEEVGVVLRFGRYVGTTNPGLRFKLPFIEQVIKVPVQRQLTQEFGFRTAEAGVRTQFSPPAQRTSDEAVMLTGDLNVAVVEWVVQYRVSDPFLFLFKVRNVDATFRDMNEAVMREVVGDRTVTEVVRVGRQEVQAQVQAQLQVLANQYEMGINIEQVVLQDVNPPDPVRPSWNEVSQAEQQRDQMINEARAEYNRVIPRARGEAQQAILQAEGYALDRVNRSQGDAVRFTTLYDAYRRAPEVTRRRMYLETMQRILPNVGRKLYVDKDTTGVLPVLSLDALPISSGAGTAQNTGGVQ